ncbi:MAG: alpha-isopropylmalate synthase regulatory domain-containing protein, partial [Dehalococcoidales bacterium]|nr:alpha-isopropylmalate synthase regulatory domain-containing protein [Dehalococcoidales bacterium]
NKQVDTMAREVSADELKAMFWAVYVDRDVPWKLLPSGSNGESGGTFSARVSRGGQELDLKGKGSGPVEALVNALVEKGVPRFEVDDYQERALGSGSAAQAIAYVRIKVAGGEMFWGAGVDGNIKIASIKAVLSALNRSSVS